MPLLIVSKATKIIRIVPWGISWQTMEEGERGWPMPKARGLVRHGGPPGWMEESDPAGVILYMMYGSYRPPSPYTNPVALTGAAQLLSDEISSCCYIINVHNHPSWATSRKEVMAWYSRIPPRLLSGGEWICWSVEEVHTLVHSAGRVLSFFSSRSELGLPHPFSRRRVCPPPFGPEGRAHSLAVEGLGESQFRRGTYTVVHALYGISTLCPSLTVSLHTVYL